MTVKPYEVAIVFTGHMIDLPGRATPRFPQEAAGAAWVAIRSAIERAKAEARGRLVGIASGARGGDLLFHEGCRLFGIERRMVLPFPPDLFIASSVAGIPNGGWEQKFKESWESLAAEAREIIDIDKREGSYSACNLRMIALAKELAERSHMIALWDGKAGDGPGGTAENVEMVRGEGGKVEIIDANLLAAGVRRN